MSATAAGASWLDSLASHPIFTLPPTSPSTPAAPRSTARTHSSSSKQQRPLAPAAKDEPQQGRGQGQAGLGSEIMVVTKQGDLLLAVGNQVRMVNLGEVKARSTSAVGAGAGVGAGDDYKILDTPEINFPVQQLILNPTSKLLAVVGVHRITIIILPRKGWSNSLSRSIPCRTIEVGKFYHSLPYSPALVKVLFHPWGAEASSLFVLDSDGKLSEYDLATDAEEPSQSFSFLPSSSSPSFASKKVSRGAGGGGRTFSADEEEASQVVGMTFGGAGGEGGGEGDWAPLTVYGLMRNGDVYALCPVGPKRATIPSSYIHALSVFVASKVDYLALSSSSPSSLSTPTKQLALTTTSSSSSSSSKEQDSLERTYALQLLYVNALVRQVTSAGLSPSTSSSSFDENNNLNNTVTLSLPSTTHSRLGPPCLQGPFLVQPSPPAPSPSFSDDEEEKRATDLLYVAYSPPPPPEGEIEGREQRAGGGGGAVLALAYDDGSVELMIEVERVEAGFEGDVVGARAGLRRSSTRRRVEEGDGAPTLLLYEVVDLGLSSSSSFDEEEEEGRPGKGKGRRYNPLLSLDPLYRDTIYVAHERGAHCIAMGGWMDALFFGKGEGVGKEGQEQDEEEEELKAVQKAVKGAEGSRVGWVLRTSGEGGQGEGAGQELVALQVVNDVYLGYQLLLLTRQLQLVGIELNLRVEASALLLPPSSSTTATTSTSTNRATKPTSTSEEDDPSSSSHPSLLLSPFQIPALLSSSSSSAPSIPSLAPTNKPLEITPTTLRQLGTYVDCTQGKVRDLVQAADEVQWRLELQLRELGRQLKAVEDLSSLSSSASSSTATDSTSKGQQHDLTTRLATAQRTQLSLLSRVDAMLQKLMQAHSPQLSTFERKWFLELERLQVEEGKLGERARRVEARVGELKGGLERLKEKAQVGGREREREELGEQQRRRLEGMLGQEAKLIAEARRKVDRLTQALASTSLS